jgi:hypothetical protein
MGKRRASVISLVAVLVLALVGLAAARAKKRAESATCVGMLFPLEFVAIQWAQEHGSDRYPTNLTYLSNHVATRWLICPRDSRRRRASDWSSFTPEHSSYELVTPGVARADTNSVFLRCRIHGHMAYVDHTVFDGTRRRHKFD